MTSLTVRTPEVQSFVLCTGAYCLGAGCDFPQPHLLPPVCQEVCDPLTGGPGTMSWVSLELWTSGMIVLTAEPRSTNKILVWVPGESSCFRVKYSPMLMHHPLQGAQLVACNALQVG